MISEGLRTLHAEDREGERCRIGERSPGVRPKTDPVAILRTKHARFSILGQRRLAGGPEGLQRAALLPELE
jgi:hypothetical protein